LPGASRNQYGPCRRVRAEPGSGVHDVADGRVLLAPPAADVADHDLAAADADADSEPTLAQLVSAVPSDFQGGCHGLVGVGVNAAGCVPEGHDAVADVLVDRAAVPEDDARAALGEVVEQGH